MTKVMTKRIMVYQLVVDYTVSEELGEETLPIFTMSFSVDNAEGFAEFIHKSMFKLANLTIETQEEDNNNG